VIVAVCDVTVILTVLNEGEGMSTLLDTLLFQSRDSDEVVLVDGGSRDGSVAVLEEYARRDGRVRYFVEPGVSIARGRDIAIERATSGIIAVSDGVVGR
jgi:glycosyltransferase involved in cell wall biosynthesis